MKNRRILYSILALVAVCIVGTCVVAGIVFFASQTIKTESVSTMPEIIPSAEGAIQLPQPLDTPIPPASTDSLPSNPAGALKPTLIPPPSDLAAQMDAIQQQVIELRKLQPDKPIIRALISPADLQKKVEADFFKDYSDQDAVEDTQVLSALGLLPKNFELRNLYLDLYSEQIAGFYDNETKEMFVVQGADFGGIERMTYAHEFVHALQDQTYDLKNGLKLDDDYCKVETEYCAAVTALVEGDASFTETHWLFGYANDQDKQDIQTFYGDYSSPVFNASPEYLQEDFMFPYLQGLEFVNSLVDRGGEAMIDAAFMNPPVSTEQILHPDKYPAEKPVDVKLPDMTQLLGTGWQSLDQNVLGEWYTFLVLSYGEQDQYRLPEKTARMAAAGWGGDQYAIYTRKLDGALVLILQTTWDTEKDAGEFLNTFRQYGEARWGDPSGQDGALFYWSGTNDGEILFQKNGASTLWLLTPDLPIQQSILGSLPGFLPAQ